MRVLVVLHTYVLCGFGRLFVLGCVACGYDLGDMVDYTVPYFGCDLIDVLGIFGLRLWVLVTPKLACLGFGCL